MVSNSEKQVGEGGSSLQLFLRNIDSPICMLLSLTVSASTGTAWDHPFPLSYYPVLLCGCDVYFGSKSKDLMVDWFMGNEERGSQHEQGYVGMNHLLNGESWRKSRFIVQVRDGGSVDQESRSFNSYSHIGRQIKMIASIYWALTLCQALYSGHHLHFAV